MLFAGNYTFINVDEGSAKRLTQLFTNWTPPEGFEFKAHYSRSDAKGGVWIAEIASELALSEAAATFAPFLDQEITPVVEVAQGVATAMKAAAWRDSIS